MAEVDIAIESHRRIWAALHAVMLARSVLEQHRHAYRELIEAGEKLYCTGWITDPTSYRMAVEDGNLRKNLSLADAALQFLAAVSASLEPYK